MYELSWALRSKPEWQRKAADPEIRGKWRQETLKQQAGSRVPLSERMASNNTLGRNVNLLEFFLA
jgi:hypothetical protein